MSNKVNKTKTSILLHQKIKELLKTKVSRKKINLKEDDIDKLIKLDIIEVSNKD